MEHPVVYVYKLPKTGPASTSKFPFPSFGRKNSPKSGPKPTMSLLNCHPKGLGEECPLADYFLLEAQSDTTEGRRRGKREVRGTTESSSSSAAEERQSTVPGKEPPVPEKEPPLPEKGSPVPEKGSGGTKEAERGRRRQQKKLAEQKRSRAVHSGGEKKRRRRVQRRRRPPPQSPNRRYWLNVSKIMVATGPQDNSS